jgi:cyanophycinase
MIRCLTLSWLALAVAATASRAEAPRPAGPLVIIGGGRPPPAAMKRFVELAGGGGRARIVVIPMASENPSAAGDSQVAEFTKLGVTNVMVLLLAQDSGSQTGAVASLEGATGIFFPGGDQSRLATYVVGTPVHAKLSEIHRRGVVIGGTSAGAAIMSEVMITGEQRSSSDANEKFTRIRANDVVTAAGLGLVTNAIIDQHFIARKRHNRLISVVLEHPAMLGVGIDENTAIVVASDGSFEVIGERGVLVLDARRGSLPRQDAAGNFSIRGMRTDLLVDGEKFDPGERGK